MKIKDRLYIATFSENFSEGIRNNQLGMEINHTCISECLNEDKNTRMQLLSQIEQDIADSCANKLVIHGPFTEIIPAGIDPYIRNAGMTRLNQAYGVAHNFSIKKMIIHNGWIPFMYFKSWQAEKGAAFWQSFMADKPDDFSIAIENVLEDEPYMLLDMMKHISDKRIRLCLDVGHANAKTQKDISVERWIELLGENISHLHLHNNDGKDDTHCSFDEGNMNMSRLLDRIRDYCPPDTTITVEAHKCLPCLEWLKQHDYI